MEMITGPVAWALLLPNPTTPSTKADEITPERNFFKLFFIMKNIVDSTYQNVDLGTT
jgi:hypothetical protein